MKKHYLITTLALIIVGVVSILNTYNQPQEPQISDLTLANIEALAGEPSGGEGGGTPTCEATTYCPYKNDHGQIEHYPLGCAGNECCAGQGYVTCDNNTLQCNSF